MDHAYVAAHALIDRYRRGLLPADEEARFEEHFFGCPACAAELEAARAFALGMKAMAAEDAVRLAHAAGLFAWLARRGRLAQAGIALAALLAAAVLPAVWLAGRDARRQAAVASARDAYQERWQGERQRTADLDRRLADSETGRVADRRQIEELRQRQATAAQSQTKPPAGGRSEAAPWLAPLVDTPLVLLHTLRGEPAAAATIDPRRAAGPLTLAIEAADDVRFGSYRLELKDAHGRTLLRQAGLRPNALETLLITFPPSFFAPGDYRLEVAGVTPAGDEAAVGSYPLRVTGPR
jgi:hypothetical protein